MDVTIAAGRDRAEGIDIDGDAGVVVQITAQDSFVIYFAACRITGDIGVGIRQVITPSEDDDSPTSTTRSWTDFNLDPVQADAAAGRLLIINEIMVSM